MPEPFSHACLFIDLGSRDARIEVIDRDLSLAWLGGRGMGTYFLGLSPRLDPLDPQSPSSMPPVTLPAHGYRPRDAW